MAGKPSKRPKVIPAEMQGAKWISLTQKKWALVDEQDYLMVAEYAWCFASARRKGGYAVAWINGKVTKMHRFILGDQARERIVDHQDGNGLNNRRNNLRIVNNSQNLANRSKPISNSSGYKGVSWNTKKGKWEAQIMVNYKKYHLGRFTALMDAVEAYDKAAKKYFGEFAVLNEK